MVSAASHKATDPKMVESQVSMAHLPSSYACTEDGYFKHPHMLIIDGDNLSASSWFFLCFGVGRHLTCD